MKNIQKAAVGSSFFMIFKEARPPEIIMDIIIFIKFSGSQREPWNQNQGSLWEPEF